MATIVRCVKGHFYDADRAKECPYCVKQEKEQKIIVRSFKGESSEQRGNPVVEEAPTVAFSSEREIVITSADRENAKKRGISADKEGVTISLFSKGVGKAYVTGWLVGLEEPVKGQDYRIIHGKNWVGRNYNMDICISDGEEIAMVNHCALIYDGKGNQFFILAGNGTTTYLNGTLVQGANELKSGDQIKIGNCLFEFVPFCREGHVWEVENL